LDIEAGAAVGNPEPAISSRRLTTGYVLSGGAIRVMSAMTIVVTNARGITVMRRHPGGPAIVDLSGLAPGVYAVSGASRLHGTGMTTCVVR
jgi:hypothetical protein